MLRQPTNVTLPKDLVIEAKTFKINLSKACEKGLRSEIESLRRQKWLAENKEAIEAWNETVAHEDVLLSEYRQF